jgi:cytochrome P450
MADMTIDTSASGELQAIRPGFFATFRLIRKGYGNPLGQAQELQQTYGNAVMQKIGRITFVHLYGADAHRLALVNEGNVFSNKEAWDQIIGRIFPNGLMLRDGDDHRYHRRLMQVGFKNKAMQRYLLEMEPQVQQAIASWPCSPGQPMLVFPAFKKLTLDLAASIFLGMDLGEEASRINKAFETTVAASMPRIPLAVPGTVLWRGIRARNYMCDYFRQW